MPDDVLKLKHLQTLNLSRCQVSTAQLQQINNHASLKWFTHNETQVFDVAAAKPTCDNRTAEATSQYAAASTRPGVATSMVAFACPTSGPIAE